MGGSIGSEILLLSCRCCCAGLRDGKMIRVAYQDLVDALLRALLKLGFEPGRARRCAQLFAETNRDGVYSHGLNRFPRFLAMIQSGLINIHAEPKLLAGFGAMERWDGRAGPGNLNAWYCM